MSSSSAAESEVAESEEQQTGERVRVVAVGTPVERRILGPRDSIALRANELLLERYAPPAVVIDEDDQVVHVQGAVEEFLELPLARTEMNLFGALDRRLRSDLRALVDRARRGQESIRGGAWTLAVRGQSCSVQATVTPLAARLPGSLLIAFESRPTDPARAGEPVGERELEARVAERTEGLREQLAVAVTEREDALRRALQLQKMELVGNLTSGIAHDFNNLLGVFLLATGSLRQSCDLSNPFQREAIEDLERAADRASLLTRQLLGFGRAVLLEKVPVDAGVAVRRIGELLPRLVGGCIAVKLAGVDEGAWVSGSQAALEQVVLNLAVNARDAMPDGGTISCRVRATAREVAISVADDGVGMDSETLRRVFEPFFTTKATGTGLGLATVADIAKRFDGRVEIESEIGRGTTFTVVLPRIAPGVGTEPPVASEARMRTRKGRVLLVEDDALVRRATERVLEKRGYTVTSVPGAREALNFLRDAPELDVVVTDVSMPDANGLELAQSIERWRPALPVVLMSGDAVPPRELRMHPRWAFLPKPIVSDALVALIEEMRRPI